ncbi:Dehydrogenase, E1 component [Dillenia turbinata]|uniref:Dehydrogenase, E1 component n=1 Tax=Dillenia turbinata TaxID=194707 RepID=A0AAN8Z345_9MAGN
MDTTFYEAQRQGRISFYVTSTGEEAITDASAAALKIGDVIFPQISIWKTGVYGVINNAMQYRELGILLWHGFTLQQFANQLFGNKDDYGKGRQMPVHFGSNKLNYFTVASTIAEGQTFITQIPHAVGAAFSLNMDKKDACIVTYFGDGGTSEGDFHAVLNFAAVMEFPVIFICRNNGWAISTPVMGWLLKAGLMEIQSICVDGNDALAIYAAVRAARKMAIEEHKPVLLKIELWRTKHDPITRFRKWVQQKGWWSDGAESELRNNIRKQTCVTSSMQLVQVIQAAERIKKPYVAELFTDVYDALPSNLGEQESSLRETIRRHPQDYPPDVPV